MPRPRIPISRADVVVPHEMHGGSPVMEKQSLPDVVVRMICETSYMISARPSDICTQSQRDARVEES